MRYLFLIATTFLLTTFACKESAPSSKGNGVDLGGKYDDHLKTLISFFDQFAYSPESGVYLSEISNTGEVLSNKVFNVALSRLIYGLSYASAIQKDYLEKAEQSSQFQLKYLTGKDSIGSYFISFYDIEAKQADSSNTFDIWQQAYGLCGLTELYQNNKDATLLASIHEYHDGFINRFHDKEHGGFYGEFKRQEGQIAGSKSLQCLMYPITAYMENLWQVDVANRSKYESHLKENLEIISKNCWNKELGWVTIKLDDQWNPCQHESTEAPCFTVVPGHNFQLASLFLRTKDWPFLTEEEKAKYKSLGMEILSTTLKKPVIPNRKLSQGFFSEVNPTNDSILDNRKTWWQHCEALLSLSLAGETYNEEILQLEEFYFNHFTDTINGGEYFFLDSNNVPQTETPKGSIGKSIYHTTEMIKFLENKALRKAEGGELK